MKACALALISIFVNLFIAAQPRYWVGGASGPWSDNNNWSELNAGLPGASYPSSMNEAIFDGGNVIVEMDILSAAPFAIQSLLVTGNATITFQRTENGGGLRLLRLTRTGNPPALQIDQGSALTIDANNNTGTLDLVLDLASAAGAGGLIRGQLYFTGTGAGDGAAALNLYTDATHYGMLTVKSTGTIKYFDDTGNTSSAPGNYLTMENGAVYEIAKNGGSFPQGNWQPSSVARVNNNGTNGPFFLGDAYGNLEWNTPGLATPSYLTASISFNNVSFISTNNTAFRVKTGASAGVNTMNINGDLSIGANAKLETAGPTVTGANGGIISVKGNIFNQGILGSSSITASNTSELRITGNTEQTFNNQGSLSGANFLFVMDKTAESLQLLSPLVLPHDLLLINGKIKTNPACLLTLIDGKLTSGGSAASFVEGPIQKIGDEGFEFPIGRGAIYSPLSISAGTDPGDAFTAEYHRSNPQTLYGAACESPLNHVSYVEFYLLSQNSGTSSRSVTLSVTAFSFATNLSTLYVACNDSLGSIWLNRGRSGLTTGPGFGSLVTGTITSNPDSGYGIFSIATTDPVATNPLPVNLIGFDAFYAGSGIVLKWQVSGNYHSLTKFEIQEIRNGEFITVGEIMADSIRNNYQYRLGRATGERFYRLRLLLDNRTASYSKVISSKQGVETLRLSSGSTVFQDYLTIYVQSDIEEKVVILVTGPSGLVVGNYQYKLNQGGNMIRIGEPWWARGAYFVVGTTSEKRTNVLRAFKQ